MLYDRFLLVGLVLSAALIAGGCRSDRIFHADFEADAVGRPPSHSPPTAPKGDEILVPASLRLERFAVVDSEPLRSRALQYLNNTRETDPIAIAFLAAPTTGKTIREAWVHWAAVPNLPADAPPLNVAVARNIFGTSVVLRFDDGEIFVRTPAGADSYEQIGTYANGRVHTVAVNVNFTDGTYGIVISEQGSPTITTGRRQVLDAGPESPRPVLYMAYGPPTTSGASYTIDDIVMRRD